MNMKEIKQVYEAPETRIRVLRTEANLMTGSASIDQLGGEDEYDDF